ncbi:MAG TPA: GntR family transcriptional regulator [Streptosporangiaceae bacterium]|nr:GntR family transcriptional regulator [Streptosporangiaceae bacterium]
MANPMYRQIAEDLREQIESGQLQPGQQLRTELELRERYGASRNTVRDAIKWLINLGLVETRPGQGTFVVQKIAPYVTTLSGEPGTGEGVTYHFQVSEHGRTPYSTDPQVEIQKANGGIAAELRLKEGAQVISRHQKRFIDGTPWSMQTSFYPQGFVLQGAERLLSADNLPQGVVQYLAETLGLRQVGYRDWITVRAPNVTEADFFRLPQDGRVAVFENFRTAFDQTGAPMRVTVTVFPTDRNQFIVKIGDVPEPQPSTEDHKS